MSLTNFEYGEEEADFRTIVKSYDDRQLVVAFIAREVIDDLLDGARSRQARRAWVEQNLAGLGTVIAAKYDQGETTPYHRAGSTMPSVTITASDINGVL